jgi:protein phosphatase
MSVRLLVASRSDVGRLRSGNEDAFLVIDELQLVAVADGMGGHQGGEVASATAIDALRAGLERGDSIEGAITGANEAVVSQAAADLALRGMGTTMTAGVLHDSALRIGHVGDSRAYLLRAGELRQVTTDHSVIAELIAAGELTEDEALVDPRRAMITRALGIDTTVEVDAFDLALEPGDRLLLCSDGLTTMIRDGAIAEILASEDDRERAADELVNAANIAGGADNITVVIVDVVEIVDTGTIDVDGSDPDATAEVPVVDAATAEADTDTDQVPVVVDELVVPDGEDADLEALRTAVEDGEPPRRHWWQRRPRS